MRCARRILSLALLAVAFSIAMLGSVRAFNPDHVAQFKQTGKCVGCDLSSADLQAVRAQAGDLTNANLTFANMYRAVLTATNFKGASLNGANLAGADLSSARNIDLTGAITDERTICPDRQRGPCK